jgi:hypothetical protein
MRKYCGKCKMKINTLDKRCPTCYELLVMLPAIGTTESKWGDLKRSATEDYVKKMYELAETNTGKMSEEGLEHLLGLTYLDAIKESSNLQEQTKKIKKGPKSNPDSYNLTAKEKTKVLQDAKKEVFGVPSIAKDSAGLRMIEAAEGLAEEYKTGVKVREAMNTAPGIHRRTSINFDSPDTSGDDDTKDWTRTVLGGAKELDATGLERVVKIAVLSTHGQDDSSMCDNYSMQYASGLSQWQPEYQGVMNTFGKAQNGMTLKNWIVATLQDRARPDVIVLLEGHANGGADYEDLVIGGESYIRKDSADHFTMTQHLQNVTGWIRTRATGPDLDLSIQEVQVKGETTLMAVIRHRVGGQYYYELVCHLPAKHYSQYLNASPAIDKWYQQNLAFLKKGLLMPGDIINVMGDTNFNTLYDAIWSPSPTFGGEITATHDKAFSASSASNTRFMRQMCNGEINWAGAPIRVHRASYLNHVPVRAGMHMAAKWGTDHPSFMSYTSIYK